MCVRVCVFVHVCVRVCVWLVVGWVLLKVFSGFILCVAICLLVRLVDLYVCI